MSLQHPFDALRGEYASLLASAKIRSDRLRELEDRSHRILDLGHQHRQEWDDVEGRTGVKRLWGFASFERESSSDYRCSPAQGDRWDQVSKNVPRGLGPYANWGASCVASYRIDHLDLVKVWAWLRALYEAELFNGFGYRQFGIHSPYLWAWMTAYRDGDGKYDFDGHFKRGLTDQQCGIVALMLTMLRLDPSLALVDAPPLVLVDAPLILPPLPPPIGLGGGDPHDAIWLQAKLNALGAEPELPVDGSYGRVTRRAVMAFQAQHKLVVDGVAGPLTMAELEKETK